MPQASAGPGITGRKQSAEGDDAGQPQRLTGWKEIAAYLGRGERTVKRWESERELPVRRVPGGGRAAVYAYGSELEDWLRSHRLADEVEAANGSDTAISVETPTDTEESSPDLVPVSADAISASVTNLKRPMRWRWVAGGLLAAAAGVVLFVGWKHLGRREPEGTVSASERALAQDLYLKGRFEWSRRTPESLDRALDDFTQSIVHDPTNAATYAGMADTYLLLREYSPMSPQEAYSRARAAATKAVELDDSLAEAHRSLAFVDAWENWDFHGAETEFERAIELDPRDPITHLWFATAFKWPQWRAVAEREFNRAQELDPSSPIILANKSIWLFENGSEDAGLELARQVEHAQPDFLAAHRYLGMMGWYSRDYPNYLAEDEKMAKLKHDPVLAKMIEVARVGYERGGEPGLLKNLYNEQAILFKSGQIGGETLALTCARMGRKDEALGLLEDDFAHHRADVLGILTAPDLLAYKGEPRYQRIFRGLNLPNPPKP